MGFPGRSYSRGVNAFAVILVVTGLACGLTTNPQQAVDVRALEAQALTLEPPREEGTFRQPELVDLRRLDAGFRFDIRYATGRNFLGFPVYRRPGAYLQRPAAAALVAVQKELERRGLGLLIFDAYRPWYVTWIFWQATPPHLREFVADPARGSRHNRGCAVDLTLYDLRTGEPLPMPTDYDDFSPRAHIDYPGGDPIARTNRDLLRSVMERAGFEPYPPEWWHYDFHEWRHYPILNLRFEELEQSGALLPGKARVDDP